MNTDAFAFIVAVVALVSILNEKLKNYCHGQRDTQNNFFSCYCYPSACIFIISKINFLVFYEKNKQTTIGNNTHVARERKLAWV